MSSHRAQTLPAPGPLQLPHFRSVWNPHLCKDKSPKGAVKQRQTLRGSEEEQKSLNLLHLLPYNVVHLAEVSTVCSVLQTPQTAEQEL